jgi:hypothetical protein
MSRQQAWWELFFASANSADHEEKAKNVERFVSLGGRFIEPMHPQHTARLPEGRNGHRRGRVQCGFSTQGYPKSDRGSELSRFVRMPEK